MQERIEKNGTSDHPAFTMRRNILHAKEDNIQLEQIRKVNCER